MSAPPEIDQLDEYFVANLLRAEQPMSRRNGDGLPGLDDLAPDPDGPMAAPDGYRLTDAGNAARLLTRHGRHLRFVPSWGRWLAFDGGRWRLDHADTIVSHLAKHLGTELLELVPHVYSNAEKASTLLSWVRRSESASGIGSTLKVARTHPGIAVDHEALDADPWLLNVRNGTVDLRTLQRRPHDPGDLQTMQAATDHDADATAPSWEAFLARILPDETVGAFVRRLSGLALVGEQIEHVLAMAIGGGANGKSTFTRVIADTLDSYAVVASRDVLLALKHHTHPTAKASLFRRRFAHSGELPPGARLDEAQVKELTGGDRITARRMREDPWEFVPSHLLWLHANHRPLIEGTDDGIWRRVLLVPFQVDIPSHERDPHLARRIVEHEAPGVLSWMLDGLADYMNHGLRIPDAVSTATDGYRAASDTVAGFLVDSGLVVAHGQQIDATELLALHSEWWAANGSGEPEKSHYQRVVVALKERGVAAGRTRSRGRFWRGVGVQEVLVSEGGDDR